MGVFGLHLLSLIHIKSIEDQVVPVIQACCSTLKISKCKVCNKMYDTNCLDCTNLVTSYIL